MDEGFSGTQAAKVVGITYRQLDYWARTDLIRPSLTDASGSGSRRRYSYKDLLELRVIKTLLDAGIKLESVRDVFEYMREHVDSDIASAHLVISGNSVMLADGDELIDVLRKGQGVLNVLSLASVKQEVDDQLPNAVELPGGVGQRHRPATGRPDRRRPPVARVSPLDAVHRSLGARMVPFGGWDMPLEYTGTIDEHMACRRDGDRVRRVAPRHGAHRRARRVRAPAAHADQRPRQGRTGAGPVHAPARRRRRLGARRHHRVVASRDRCPASRCST